MNYYAETALTGRQMPGQTIDGAIYDLDYNRSGQSVFCYPQCDEYLASSIGSPTDWYIKFKEKIKLRVDNQYEQDISELNYKKHFESVSIYMSFYYVAIYVTLSLFFFYFFEPFLYSVVINQNLLKAAVHFKNQHYYIYYFIFFYIVLKIVQYLNYHHKHKDSAIFFNRQNGMIETKNNGQWIRIPFNEFHPMVVHSYHFNSQYRIRLLLCHGTLNLQFPIKSQTRVDSVIAWSYIKHFMDISRPLPDIPLHEPSRHLDPVTRAYDIKTGRDPYYWRKMKYHELAKREREARKRASELFDI